MTRIELLAAARDLECGLAAVNSGADAVYIGGTGFSARAAAFNSVKDIERLCVYGHKYFCRVYLSLNTLLHDREIEKAVRLGRECADAGIDAFIIQDMGLLEAGLPGLPLIASTQCDNSTPEKVLFLEKAGFSRVILSRELSLPEIRKIRRETKVELECFVHGSLCWSYSGRCWLSFAMGGRSGNRGECGQPCRLPWSLTPETGSAIIRDSHLLSLKDLNLSDKLKDLMDAGVSSFKIEGRLKGPDYVKNITTYYRSALDELLDGKNFRKSSSGASAAGFNPDPDKTFNRGYSRYFIDEKPSDIFSMDTPKMKGESIGVAGKTSRDGFELKGASLLRPGDGLCWFGADGTLTGSTVVKISGGKVIVRDSAGISVGTEIFRNLDSDFVAKLGKARPARKITVVWTVAETADGVKITALDEDAIRVELELGKAECRPAENTEKARVTWSEAFGKLGETEYISGGVKFEKMVPPFVPVSDLNRIRRTLIASLQQAREAARPRPVRCPEDPSWPYPEKELDFESGVLNSSAEKFYRKHGVTTIERAPESGMDMTGRRIARSRACPLKDAGLCGYKGKLFIVDGKGRRFELRPDCRKCEISVYLGH